MATSSAASASASSVAAFDGFPTYDWLIRSVDDCAIYALTPEGRVATWNTGAERIKGYRAPDVLGRYFSLFYTDDDRAAGVPEKSLRTAREAGRYSAEGLRRRKDGSLFKALVVIDPLLNDGKLVGFAKITRDITQQREAAAAAQESERGFRLLVQGVTDCAIFMLDPHGRIANWNAGAERINGYGAAEIVGKPFSQLYTADDIANGAPKRALETARREGRFEAAGWRVRKDGGHFWAGVVIERIVENGELLGFAKITRDLSERRKAELELERSREQLWQAQKMEAVGQLTAGLAHDFNNLLTGIIGSLERMNVRISQGRLEGVDRYAAGALGAAQQAAVLTHRLVAYARRQALDAKATDVNALILEMNQGLIGSALGPQIQHALALADDAWLVFCDPHQLENALLSLCANARDAMRDGGSLTINTANVVLDPEAATRLEILRGEYVAISVADTGAGMPADVTARAFEPFYTTKPRGAGSGLGLSMVHGFVRQSGGQVTIDSEIGKGATVRMYLPRAHGGASDESPPAPANLASAGDTVVVVEDDAMIRTLIVDVLQDLGYRVLEASDAATGLTALRSEAAIDLLIADVMLPGGMNGRDLADAARQTRPELQVLFITGSVKGLGVTEGKLRPGMRILAKPFTLEELATKIATILQK